MSIIPDFTAQTTPTLKPVLFFDLKCEQPTQVYANGTQSQTYAAITGGSVKSLDEKLPFDAKILYGKDDITFQTHAPQVGRLDCNLYLEFANGETGMVEYTGVVQFIEKVAQVASDEVKTMTFEDGYVTNHPVFKLPDTCTAESWVNSINFIGKGRFVRDEDNVLHVQYYIYTFA